MWSTVFLIWVENMSRSEQKIQTRQRIAEAAGRTFRKAGYNGAGVDGLAKAAGVTSGAFYVHFSSKAEAFHESIAAGMAQLKEGILQAQAKHASRWWGEFVRFYLSEKRSCDLSEGCALQALVSEVVRSDDVSRRLFQASFEEVCVAITHGPSSPGKPETSAEAYAALASLAGGVTLARAVFDSRVAEQIAHAIERQLIPSAS
jgi:TetR/AcrR family transcriptional regulator, transcriptional repressor for nem operon